MSTAHDALTTAWHLAVLAGPATGTVIPLTPRTTVGRGNGLDDATVSRTHLALRTRDTHVAAQDASSVNGTRVRRPLRPWRQLGRRPVRCPVGTRFRLGETELVLRRRPTDLRLRAPDAPAPGRRWMVVLLLLPVLAVVVLVALRGHRSPWSLLLLAPMLLMALLRLVRPATNQAGGRQRGPLPDPAVLLLAVAARGLHGQEPGGRAPSAWLGPRRRRRAVLALEPGDRVCLRGPRARAALAWWTAQVLAAGGTRVEPSAHGVSLVWGTGTTLHRAELMVAGPDGPPGPAQREITAPRRVPLTGEAWWLAVLAGAGLTPPAGTGPGPGPDAVPDAVSLEEVTGPVTPQAVRRRWRASLPGTLAAVLGTGPLGRRSVDLVTQGPHALLAGTTGSGKSELLTSWLLQLAVAHPPSRLTLVLVDYKGGATFAPLERLPHTAGVLTDLDPAATERALASLTAEVHRRERLLASLGAKDVAHVDAEQSPARLLVVVDEFATLAGEHPEVLAALVRVAAQGRSLGIHLVLATQRPAGNVSPAIRANTTVRVCLRVLDGADSRDVLGHDGAAHLEPRPGRVLVGEDPVAVQAPWCGREQDLARVVEAVRAAACEMVPAWRPWRPWVDPLPSAVRRDQVEGTGPTAPDGLLLALTDLPSQQRRGTWCWDLARPLLVLGTPGSGRSTALDSAALAALAAGRAVHRAGSPRRHPMLRDGLQGVGTVVGPGEPRRLARLLGLAAEGALAGDVLLVDDVDALVPALDQVLGAGQGQGLLETLVRTAPATGTALAVAGPVTSSTARWAGAVPVRLVLGAWHGAQAALAGLPHGTVTGRGPGRGVVVEGSEITACQVLLPAPDEEREAPSAGHGTGPGEGHGPGRGTQADGPAPLRLLPLPRHVAPGELPPGAIGLGGDAAAPVHLPHGAGALVVGPPGSGRSTALSGLVRAVEDDGGTAVVLDDLDLAGATELARAEEALASGARVLAAATTERVAATYRGPLALLRERAALVVLWPGVGTATQVAGTSLRGSWDPEALTVPGRGVLVHRGRVVPLQMACAGPEQGPGHHGCDGCDGCDADAGAVPSPSRAAGPGAAGP